ncbi:trm6/tRNA(m1A58)-methyltransferase subunit [Blumeria hordei DH14]|uniref:tRNA (adenine(58)-N(1))-methyltransferase non-catalytic subunit TRM6 n=1 Tax=Blumeria graminis f. sp. hordei (strain DH14) TaxID=546991 RepID=N1JE30_BLUG1|nr:trm6/tRNA(m1A58)-methyltransferase subunit [Blumeria hordei DH14]
MYNCHRHAQTGGAKFLDILAIGIVHVQDCTSRSTITLPKYGSFPANLLLSRPYYLTYELLDRESSEKYSLLRVVPASEIHADTIAEEDGALEQANLKDGVQCTAGDLNGEVIMRTNRNIIDSGSRQTLSMTEIEELKKEGTGAGKDLIEKLMASHIGIEQKTLFSLAKYKLSKTKKYLKRFTVLPVDVPSLTRWLMEQRDASKILEMREEMLALIGSWANVHYSTLAPSSGLQGFETNPLTGRWLVSLFPVTSKLAPLSDFDVEIPFATSNTITLVHNNAQPNLSLMKYFSYIPDSPMITVGNSRFPHPLSTHLLPINWLQLLSPHQDTTYATTFPQMTAEELNNMKSSKRGNYYRKQRRWARARYIVSQTLHGDFDGLVVASHMDPVSILRPLLPLLRGGAPVCVYSPYIEPLTILADVFSTSRRTAFIQSPPKDFACLTTSISQSPSIMRDISLNNSLFIYPLELVSREASTPEMENNSFKDIPTRPLTKATWPGSEDFPLNPTLLLNATVHSAQIREWQVLPGRTHPLMTGRGGAGGYIFTATKVLPAEGRVEARGKFGRKRGGENDCKDEEQKKAKTEGELLMKIDPTE